MVSGECQWLVIATKPQMNMCCVEYTDTGIQSISPILEW